MLEKVGAMGSIALLAVLVACQLIEAKPGYVLTVPQILRAGAEESFCISLHGAEEPRFPFTLRLAHKDTHEEHDFEYEISESFSECKKLKVPSETGNYNITVLNSTTETAQSAPTEVEVKSQNFITLIQTDKPIYKPGQKVRFRVLTLTRDLSTRTGLIQSIYIKNPNDIRVKQWLSIESDGLTSFNYPMPEEPKLGEWKIEVTIDGESVIQTYKVEEYVLPRFEVKVTPPTYLLVNASSIDGQVCAEYTYGKPVEGYVSLEVCLVGYRSTGRPCYYETREINGCYKFSINSDEVEMSNSKFYLYWSKLQIKASVKELNTGAVVNDTSKEPSVTYDPLKISLEDDTNGYFKPNFPYHGRAKVTTPDGRPAPNELIKVIVVDHRNDIRLASNYTTDAEGVVHFSVCDFITEKTEDFSIEARAILYSEPDSIQGYANSLYMPRAYKTVRQWFSPSKSYISIPRTERLVPCGDTLEVDIPYSTTLNSFTKFYYQVMSRGSILQTGHKLHHFLKHDSTEFLQVPMESCLQEVPLPSPPPEVSEGVQGSEVEEPPAESFLREPMQASAQLSGVRRRRKRSTETEMGEQEAVEGEQMEGGEEAQEEPPMSPPPPPPSRHVSHFTLQIPVTEEMSPEANLLVYYVRDDGETVADSVSFKVEACFKNKVNMEFAEKKVVPGGEATLRLQAEPGSLCSIGVVDKSISILGGDHQITPDKMFDILKKEYWMTPNDHRYYSKNLEYCKTKAEGNENNLDPHMSYVSSSYVDAIQAFRQAGMAVVTNMELETRPCKREMLRFFDADMTPLDGGLPGPGFGMPLPLGINYRNSERRKPSTSPLRSYFPETWLWELEKVGDSGVLEMKKPVPHTITKWVGNTLCTNPAVGLGVSPMTSLTTFQPFFLSMKLPYAAVRGERFPLHVTVFNYLDRCLNMQLTVETGEGLSVVIRDHLKLPFCLCGGKSKTQSYYLNTDKIGNIPVFAKAKIVTGTCDNNVELDTEYEGLTDAVKRDLLVKGEGVVQEYSRSFYLCPQASEPIEEALVLPLPEDIVPESARGTVSVIGDIMGPALSNLDNLVQLPTGCGEQTMINFAPNIYVLRYLTFTMQLTEDMKLLTETYMEIGYNRELTYAHQDGSFSAFGEKDTSGSTWLTAFVLKSFAQAQRFIFIDQTVMDKSIAFLRSTALENGCFREVGKVFSSYMMGGLNKISGEDDTALTAFVIVAMLETNTPSSDRVLRAALRCVSMQPLDEMDTYTLSLVAYALALNDTSSEHTGRAMEELNKRVISDGITGYWGRDGSRPPAVNTWHYVTAPSAEIEMTSYGLMATLLYYSDDAITRAQPYVLWLSQQRSAFGGFSSTQDTVLGLQAMSEFASATYTSDPTDLTVRFEGEETSTTFDVVSGVNTLLLQRAPIQSLPANMSISVNGTGCILAQANVRFNKQPKDLGMDTELFDLSVAVRRSRKKRSDCARRSMRICVSFRGNNDVSAGMTMLTVKMVTAWTPVLDSLRELKSIFANLGIKRYENDVEKGLIVFYFEELDVRARCFEMDVEQDRELAVTDSKPAQIQAYQYYETDATAITSYKIKTTCGTKEEIPTQETDERWVPGVPIPVQVRVGNDMAVRPIPEQRGPGCPVCLHEKPANFNELICQSNAIYKALAGRTGKAPMKIQADLRPKKKRRIFKFASFSLNGGCQCDLLHPPKSRRRRLRRLLILAGSENSFVQREMTGNDAINHTINLDEKSVIIHLDTNRKLERETRRKAKKCNRKIL